VIANGYLRLDREEWIRVVEKRSAALQGAPLAGPATRQASRHAEDALTRPQRPTRAEDV
jgi:hypothetical protein